jgi:DNA-binding PadR family transcriptional regulator
MGRYLRIIKEMRRKPGALVPLEVEILTTLTLAMRDGLAECHGFQIAKLLQEGSKARLLTAHGTLYRALGRLEEMGLLESRWEDPHLAAREGRPRRRLYRITDAGAAALTRARADMDAPVRRRRRLARA